MVLKRGAISIPNDYSRTWCVYIVFVNLYNFQKMLKINVFVKIRRTLLVCDPQVRVSIDPSLDTQIEKMKKKKGYSYCCNQKWPNVYR